MSGSPRTRRLTGPVAHVVPPRAEASEEPALPLVSLLAHASRLTDVLPRLHQYALELTGGACALLFEIHPRNAVLQATSGYGLDELRTDPWVPSNEESVLVSDAFGRRTTTFVADLDRQMPDLASRWACRLRSSSRSRATRSAWGCLATSFGRVDGGVVGPEWRKFGRPLATLSFFRLRQTRNWQRDIRGLRERILRPRFPLADSPPAWKSLQLTRLLPRRTSAASHRERAIPAPAAPTATTSPQRAREHRRSDAASASAMRHARAELFPTPAPSTLDQHADGAAPRPAAARWARLSEGRGLRRARVDRSTARTNLAAGSIAIETCSC